MGRYETGKNYVKGRDQIQRQRLELMQLQTKKYQRLTANHQKLGKGKREFSYRFQRGHFSVNPELLTFRTVKQYIFIVLNHPVDDTFYSCPRKLIQ